MKNDYFVENTKGEDLDVDFSSVLNSNADVKTAFQILEHLVAPFNVLNKTIKKNSSQSYCVCGLHPHIVAK